MATLKQLSREARQLANYAKKAMPREVSRVWLWTAQNAFLTETDPSTGKKWPDRQGVAYGKNINHRGNIEAYLTYSKLHRTGRLLRGLKGRYVYNGNVIEIELYNDVPYAEEHENGSDTNVTTIKKPYVRSGATGVVTGGKIVARPHMKPSAQILRSPQRLLEEKMKTLGWNKG